LVGLVKSREKIVKIQPLILDYADVFNLLLRAPPQELLYLLLRLPPRLRLLRLFLPLLLEQLPLGLSRSWLLQYELEYGPCQCRYVESQKSRLETAAGGFEFIETFSVPLKDLYEECKKLEKEGYAIDTSRHTS
jgi:hypothetical protein